MVSTIPVVYPLDFAWMSQMADEYCPLDLPLINPIMSKVTWILTYIAFCISFSKGVSSPSMGSRILDLSKDLSRTQLLGLETLYSVQSVFHRAKEQRCPL